MTVPAERRCSGSLIGVIVWRDGRVLLEHGIPPSRYTLPCDHVTPGETYQRAADRVLTDLGLTARHLHLVHRRRQDSSCGVHDLEVYETAVDGTPPGRARWVTKAEVAVVDGLDPVWAQTLTRMGWFR